VVTVSTSNGFSGAVPTFAGTSHLRKHVLASLLHSVTEWLTQGRDSTLFQTNVRPNFTD